MGIIYASKSIISDVRRAGSTHWRRSRECQKKGPPKRGSPTTPVEPLRQYVVQGEQQCGPRDGRPRQPRSEAVSEREPEAMPEPEVVSAPVPVPRERDDHRKLRGKAAFIEIGRSAIVSGVLAPPD
jgi:hypothetical protein